jgi:hypothetical protein
MRLALLLRFFVFLLELSGGHWPAFSVPIHPHISGSGGAGPRALGDGGPRLTGPVPRRIRINQASAVHLSTL